MGAHGKQKSRAPVQWEQVPKGGVPWSSYSKEIDAACDRNWDEAWGAEVNSLVGPLTRCLSGASQFWSCPQVQGSWAHDSCVTEERERETMPPLAFLASDQYKTKHISSHNQEPRSLSPNCFTCSYHQSEDSLFLFLLLTTEH